MVLAAIIPTTEGAVWHGSRTSLLPAPSGSAAAAGRQSLRLAVRSGAALAAVPPPPPPPPAAGPAAVLAQHHPCSEALPMPAGTNKRAKSAEREKAGKRKRESDVEGRAERPAASHGDMRVKEKKEHDKYCHFCQHVKVNMMACGSGDCTHRFCTYCLAVHLGVDTDSVVGKGITWHCPTCSASCCCSQPECNKAHRHCKAFRYRCRRAAAASLRMSAAHALVSLGVPPAKGKSKSTLPVQGTPIAPVSTQHREVATTGVSLERPAKRKEQFQPEKHSRDGESKDDVGLDPVISAEQMESEAGQTAAGVLASFSMGTRGARSPSPASEAQDGTAAGAETCTEAEDGNEGGPQLSTGRLEQLAMFALQSLAAMEPARDRSPQQPDKSPAREVSEESSASTLATPRTVVVNVPRDGSSRSKMAIDLLTSTPPSVPSSPAPCDVTM